METSPQIPSPTRTLTGDFRKDGLYRILSLDGGGAKGFYSNGNRVASGAMSVGVGLPRVLFADPMKSFHEQLKEEVASYERLQRGEFEELQNFHGLGRLLIALRISQGVSQRELAERLEVHESQVSRDERNEYHGVTVERANRVLEALGVQVTTRVASTERASSAGRRGRVPA